MADMSNHPVLKVLDSMEETVASKAHDYADDQDVYSNFRGAAAIAGVTTEQALLVLIGVKVERLRQLSSGKAPNHESIEDTLLDLANYSALLLGYLWTEGEEVLAASVTRAIQGSFFDA